MFGNFLDRVKKHPPYPPLKEDTGGVNNFPNNYYPILNSTNFCFFL